MTGRRAAECGELLDFAEVHRRLNLGTRTDIGTREIPIAQVIGSVSRVHEFDGCFRPRTKRLRDTLDQIRASHPNAADRAILVYQVDHAYFVIDGHKRLSLAIDEGREFIDAEVSWYPSRFHLERGTTMDDIRLSEAERRFRRVTGLETGVPDARFPLADPDAYLELAESVKSHGYDLSRAYGRVVDPVEAARHWYDVIYRPAVDVASRSGLERVLGSHSAAELFLVLRRGAQETMDQDWALPDGFAERGVENLRRADPGPLPAAIARVARRHRAPHVLAPGDVAQEHGDPTEPTIIHRPRRESDVTPE